LKKYEYKLGHPQELREKYIRKRQAEAKILFNTLNEEHPNICPALGWFPEGDLSTLCRICFLFPFITNSQTPPLSLPYIQAWVSSMLKALAHLHSKNLIYCNMKHDNVLFHGVENKFVLIDFGDVLVHNQDYPYPEGGSGLYKAPEQVSGIYDYSADLYSLGIALAIFCNGDQTAHKISDADRDVVWEKLKNRTESEKLTFWKTSLGFKLQFLWGEEVADLVYNLTHYDPRRRFSPDQALEHPFFKLSYE